MISNKVIAKSVRKMKIAHLPGIKRALAESVKSAGVIHNALEFLFAIFSLFSKEKFV